MNRNIKLLLVICNKLTNDNVVKMVDMQIVCFYVKNKWIQRRPKRKEKEKQTAIITINVVGKDTMSTIKTRTGGQ